MGTQRPENAIQPETKTLALGPFGLRDWEKDSKVISREGGAKRA
jgi:hypothetical protein